MTIPWLDIEAWVLDANCASLVPHHFATKAGVRVQVLDEFEEEAKRVIEESKATGEGEPTEQWESE